MFGYLAEFWDSISEAVVGGTTYTVAWFEQVGNAVAGGIGNILLSPLKVIVDFFLAIAYLLKCLWAVINLILSFFSFLFEWIYNLFEIVLTTPPTTGEVIFDTNWISFFTSIPLFTLLLDIMVWCLIFLAIWKITTKILPKI